MKNKPKKTKVAKQPVVEQDVVADLQRSISLMGMAVEIQTERIDLLEESLERIYQALLVASHEQPRPNIVFRQT